MAIASNMKNFTKYLFFYYWMQQKFVATKAHMKIMPRFLAQNSDAFLLNV